jgi:hypothetical protein
MCDCETPTLFDDTERAARREHQCVECGRTITPSSRYRDIKGLWNGSWSAYAVCLPCADLRKWAERLGDGCDCVPFGQLFTVLREDDQIMRRLTAFPLPSQSVEDHARIGALLGHYYGVLHADADEEHREYRAYLAKIEAKRGEPGYAASVVRGGWAMRAGEVDNG